MRKLLLSWVVIFLICLISCKTSQIGNFQPTDLFYLETECPQCAIDSISLADSLDIDVSDYKKWFKHEFYTSDSVMQKVYWFYDDSLNISISITEASKQNKYILRMSK